MKAFIAIALLLALGLAACFTASFTGGTIKCSSDQNHLCPTGATCVNGFCYHNPDLSPTDFSAPFFLDGGVDLNTAD